MCGNAVIMGWPLQGLLWKCGQYPYHASLSVLQRPCQWLPVSTGLVSAVSTGAWGGSRGWGQTFARTFGDGDKGIGGYGNYKCPSLWSSLEQTSLETSGIQWYNALILVHAMNDVYSAAAAAADEDEDDHHAVKSIVFQCRCSQVVYQAVKITATLSTLAWRESVHFFPMTRLRNTSVPSKTVCWVSRNLY